MPPEPLPIPGSEPDDEPTFCVRINNNWLAPILGALMPMKYPEYWAGTLEENQTTRRQAVNLMAQIAQAENCGDEVDLRQNPENACQLQISHDGGETWALAFDYSLCLRQPINKISRYHDGNIEISYDGGETWTVDTSTDPRYTSIVMDNPYSETGDTTRCKAAWSAMTYIEASVDNLIDELNAQASVATAIAAVVAIIAIVLSAGALLPAVAGLVGVATGLGASAIANAFDAGTYEMIRCIFYCNALEDGSWGTAEYNMVYVDALTQLTGVAMLITTEFLKNIGPVGLTNAGRMFPDAGSGCETCECWGCHKWTGPEFCSGWVGGYGHECSETAFSGEFGYYGGYYYTAWAFNRQAPGITVRSITIEMENAAQAEILFKAQADSAPTQGDEHTLVDNRLTILYNMPVSERLYIYLYVNGQPRSWLRSMTIRFTGTSPFGETNCYSSD